MDLKWIALAALVGGIALAIYGYATKRKPGSGVDITSRNAGMILGGAAIALVGNVYLIVFALIAI